MNIQLDKLKRLLDKYDGMVLTHALQTKMRWLEWAKKQNFNLITIQTAYGWVPVKDIAEVKTPYDSCIDIWLDVVGEVPTLTIQTYNGDSMYGNRTSLRHTISVQLVEVPDMLQTCVEKFIREQARELIEEEREAQHKKELDDRAQMLLESI